MAGGRNIRNRFQSLQAAPKQASSCQRTRQANTQQASLAGFDELRRDEERVLTMLKDAPLVRLLQHHTQEGGNRKHLVSFSQFKIKPNR